MARVGIFGGSFNPPHLGHLICAQEALSALDLDHVVLVPVHAPPHKELRPEPGPERRLELCRLAVDGDERLRVSRVELDRPPPSFTADTLESLRADAPDDERWLIVGGDMAASMGEWHEPERVLALAHLAVAERTGFARADVAARLEALGARADFFAMPRVDVSSSLVRARVAEGKPIRYLVPAGVEGYIRSEGLYR